MRVVREYRELQKIDIDSFRSDLRESPLCISDLQTLTLDGAVTLFHDILEFLLDLHAPPIKARFRENRSPWWNAACQEARRERRKAARNKKKDDPQSCAVFKEKSFAAAIIINHARNQYYDKKLDGLKGDPRGTFKVINQLLDKEHGSRTIPNGESDEAVANNLKDFFDSKVKTIYKRIEEDTQLLPPPRPSTCPTVTKQFSSFEPVSAEELSKLIRSLPNKSSKLDVLPMWLFKACLPELMDIVQYIVNTSLENGVFPTALKAALIHPGLKKPGLDSDDMKNYRPISNLTYLSKILEKYDSNSQRWEMVDNLPKGKYSSFVYTNFKEIKNIVAIF